MRKSATFDVKFQWLAENPSNANTPFPRDRDTEIAQYNQNAKLLQGLLDKATMILI